MKAVLPTRARAQPRSQHHRRIFSRAAVAADPQQVHRRVRLRTPVHSRWEAEVPSAVRRDRRQDRPRRSIARRPHRNDRDRRARDRLLPAKRASRHGRRIHVLRDRGHLVHAAARQQQRRHQTRHTTKDEFESHRTPLKVRLPRDGIGEMLSEADSPPSVLEKKKACAEPRVRKSSEWIADPEVITSLDLS